MERVHPALTKYCIFCDKNTSGEHNASQVDAICVFYNVYPCFYRYEIFHKDQTDIVKQYPEMVKGELNNYDGALCRLFMVDRTNPVSNISVSVE